ncbi:SGNH/GDSL hydrolase family protein [Staphylococcus haemolyticus]|uniref:SGNH/GDSL hydrolase family protein n=1 Tax=Staphylococcus haemolyticus TaxID=1283 RepID=UPI00069E567F|nr:SGNH/GDSL hydrolase family protein [Staphylococcus haemolyticus]
MLQKLKDVATNINVSTAENGFIGANFYTEDDGSACIRITIKDNNQVLDFNKTDMLPRLDLFCSDGSIFTNEPLDILIPDKGVIQYKVSDNVIAHPGRMDAKLFLANKSDSIHVANFYFTITDSGMTGPIGKEIHLDSLQNLVENVMKENAIGLLDESFKSKLEKDLQTYVTENPDLFKGEKGEEGVIKFENLSEEQRLALKGESGESLITDKSVTHNKTDFITTGKNIFNLYNLLENKLISYTTGLISDNNFYITSDFLPVQSSTQYTQSNSDVIVFYDNNKQFISGLSRVTPTQARTFTTPENAKFIRTSTIKEGVDAYSYKTYQIEKGANATSYESFKYHLSGLAVELKNNVVKNNNIADSNVGIEKLNFIKSSQNMFNPNKVTNGVYINPTTGALSSNASYSASDFIMLSDSTDYIKNNTLNLYAFYDANGNFIKTTTTSTNKITKPSNAQFVRISAITTAVKNTMLVAGTSLPSQFVPYKKYIPSEYLELSNVEIKQDITDVFGKFNLKSYTAEASKQSNPDVNQRLEIAFIGDSWVQGGEFKQGDRLTLPLRDRMQKVYGDGGIGFVSFANGHIGNGEVAVNLTGDWTHYDEDPKKADIALSKGLDSAMVESSTVGDSIKVQFYEDLDFYEIHTLNTGTWRYNIDGGDWVTVDATQQEVTPITLSLGKHIINIEIVSGKVTFIGSYAYKGNKGVVVHKIGNGGLRGGHMTSTDRANYVKQLKRCRANTFGILLGTNEMAQNIPISTYINDLKEIVSRIREAKPLASIFLIAPSGNKYDGKQLHTIEDYSNAQLNVAKDLNLGHVSLYRNLGDYATTNANGLMYTDGVHPNKDGGYAICNVVYNRLLRL